MGEREGERPSRRDKRGQGGLVLNWWPTKDSPSNSWTSMFPYGFSSVCVCVRVCVCVCVYKSHDS